MNETQTVVERARYMIGNPSAWEAYDDGASGIINALVGLVETITAERDEARALADRLKLEAQCHACEVRTANSTIYEIYQVLSGGKGEPGNWHGAEPARQFVENYMLMKDRATAAEAALAEAMEMLEPFAKRVEDIIHAHLSGHTGPDDEVLVTMKHLDRAHEFLRKHDAGRRPSQGNLDAARPKP